MLHKNRQGTSLSFSRRGDGLYDEQANHNPTERWKKAGSLHGSRVSLFCPYIGRLVMTGSFGWVSDAVSPRRSRSERLSERMETGRKREQRSKADLLKNLCLTDTQTGELENLCRNLLSPPPDWTAKIPFCRRNSYERIW